MATKEHEARSLTKDEALELYEHIRAVETLVAEKDDIQADITERKTLCCEQLPVRKDVFDFILKRRKANKANVGNFDEMLEFLEEAIAEVEAERRDSSAPAARGNASPSLGAAVN